MYDKRCEDCIYFEEYYFDDDGMEDNGYLCNNLGINIDLTEIINHIDCNFSCSLYKEPL